MSLEVPTGWARANLSELLAPGGLFDGPFGSSLKTSDYTDAGVRVIRLENVANLRFVEDKHSYISHAKYVSLKKHTVAEGDVIVGSFVDGAVRVCVLPRLSTKAIAKADCFCIRSRSELDRRFLAFQLGSRATHDALVEEIHGATRPRITTRQLRRFEILLAPVAEQRRIVAKVESLLEQVNRAKERLDLVGSTFRRLRQAVLAAAYSGGLTADWREQTSQSDNSGTSIAPEAGLPDVEIPSGWRWATTMALCDSTRAITYGVIKLGATDDSGVPTLRSSDVRSMFIDRKGIKRIARTIADQYARTYLRGGEVVVTVRGTLGGVAVVPSEMAGYNISREVAQLPLEPGVSPKFVTYVIAASTSQEWLAERAKGVAYTGVNIEDLRRLPLPLPSRNEQDEIVRRVDALFAAVDTAEQKAATAIARAERLPQAILAKAFSGELVPTEAELARAEGRTYETAEELLARIQELRSTARSVPQRR